LQEAADMKSASKFSALALVAVGSLLGATRAGAVERGIYVGGALGQSASGLDAGRVNYNDNDLGWKLFAGVRPFKLLALEADYLDLGQAKSGDTQARTKAFGGFVLGFLPLPVVDIYGKVGVMSWHTDASSPTFSLKTNGGDLALGAGVQLHFGPVAARLEYEAFEASAASKPSLLSLGVSYTFL
jgi:hypothetical protein